MRYGGTFDCTAKEARLVELERELQLPNIWDDRERAQALGRERVSLERVVNRLKDLSASISDAHELLELAEADADADTAAIIEGEIEETGRQVAELEFNSMFFRRHGCGERLCGYSGRIGRHGGAGLGGYAAQNVPEVGRES